MRERLKQLRALLNIIDPHLYQFLSELFLVWAVHMYDHSGFVLLLFFCFVFL